MSKLEKEATEEWLAFFAGNKNMVKWKVPLLQRAERPYQAYGIGRGDEVGTLEVGKKADMVIWDADSFEFLCYRMGSNLAIETIKGGEIF